jgi:heterodisulfide reductase subunit C
MRVDPAFREEVQRRSGRRFDACFQCLTCAGGCPVVEDMDYHPTQVVRLVEFGQKEKVLKSRAIWMCVGCHACVSQCPNKVHIPALMDTLREMALENGVAPPEGRIAGFHKIFLEEVRKRGRIYELGLGLKYKLRSRTIFQDFLTGMRLLWKGRFKLLPDRVRGISELRKIMGGENGEG